MAFGSIVADLLNRFLGDYVENFDRSQLQIGIFGGDVVLQDLILKQSALDQLGLPVKIVFGHLGKLVLKTSWRNLYSAPVIASIERLFLLVVPNEELCYNAEKEEKWKQEMKQAVLARIEEAKKLVKEKEKSKEQIPSTFAEKLAAQITKNVQVSIRDIHIRYEVRHTFPQKPFSVGVTLHNLSVHSTDENGEECNVQGDSPQFYKVLVLECLAVYWNCKSRSFPESTGDHTALLEEFKNSICTNEKAPKGFSYKLGPINWSSSVRINPNTEQDGSNFSIPKILSDFVPEKLSTVLGPINWLSNLRINPNTEQDCSNFSIPKILLDFVPKLSDELRHTNVSAELSINYITEQDGSIFSIPKILLDFALEKLSVGVSKDQYRHLIELVELIDRMTSAAQYRKYRPQLTSYHGNYKQWWKFAYTCVLEEEVRRRRRNWNWEHMKAHRKMCKDYAEVYQVKLTKGGKMSPEQKELLVTCEKALDLTNLVIIRQRVEVEQEVRHAGRRQHQRLHRQGAAQHRTAPVREQDGPHRTARQRANILRGRPAGDHVARRAGSVRRPAGRALAGGEGGRRLPRLQRPPLQGQPDARLRVRRAELRRRVPADGHRAQGHPVRRRVRPGGVRGVGAGHEQLHQPRHLAQQRDTRHRRHRDGPAGQHHRRPRVELLPARHPGRHRGRPARTDSTARLR